MLNNSELEIEKNYLNKTIDSLENSLENVVKVIEESDKAIREMSQFFAGAFYEMDDEEKVVQRNIYEKIQLDNVALKQHKALLERQKKSAYFGRIDFVADDEKTICPYYVGISCILNDDKTLPLVIDWRSPLASMYYDFELGRASYLAPAGEIRGSISLKRQYKTSERNLVYAFNSSVTIGDEILREVLNANSDDKMKNIVATIQKEQNHIIRSDEGKTLLVQGVAGSGKTSMALHRVAYLLYKNQIKASDILIITPSSLFGDYISNVLPELGEQNTPKLTFDEIASNELRSYLHFLPRSQMIEDLLLGNEKRAKEVQLKAGFDFYEKLKDFLVKFSHLTFKAKDINIGEDVIKANDIDFLFNEKYKNKNPSVRLEWIADHIVDQMNLKRENEKDIFVRVKRILFNMFEQNNILEIYKTFLTSLQLELNFYDNGEMVGVGFEDVPAILYIKDYFIGIETQKHFKHIVIDEMQDYSPIVFDLFDKIFTCQKTILGDIYQCFDKTLDDEYLKKLSKLLSAKLVTLNTTYRNTRQIFDYTNNIMKIENVNSFNREGKLVSELKLNENYLPKFLQILDGLTVKYDKIAVITPTITSGYKLFEILSKNYEVALIDESCGEINQAVSIIPAVYTKGLEFDAVIYVDGFEKQIPQYLEKNVSYISCTRALHSLTVFKK